MNRPQNPNLALEEQLCFALCRASRALTRAYTRRLEPLGLSYSQYLVLLALWEKDGLPARRIAERVQLDPATMTPLLKRLEELGLVTRRRPEDNQRTVLITLTDAGWGLQATIADVQREMAQLTGLTPARLASLREELHALADGVLERDTEALA